MDVDSLYQEIILDHYKKPHGRGLREPYEAEVHHVNPSCGDEVTLRVHLDGGSVRDVSYEGLGCSISQASASMMTQLLKGKDVGEVEAIRARFRDMVMGDKDAAEDASLGSLRALGGVARFPARVKCALLAWNALETALAKRAE